MTKAQQLLPIGCLEQLQCEAMLPYAHEQAVLCRCQQDHLAVASQISEAMVLHLLSQYKQGHARCILFEPENTTYFAQLKRLFMLSEQAWGKQVFTNHSFAYDLNELEELMYRRLALLQQHQLDNIHAYNQQATRIEPVIYLVLQGLSTSFDQTVIQRLEALYQQGAKAGIVLFLLYNQTALDHPDLPTSTYQQFRDFWREAQKQVLLLDIEQEAIQPVPQYEWKLLKRFGLKWGLEDSYTIRKVEQLSQLQLQKQQPQKPDFLHIPIGVTDSQPAFFSLGELSNTYHALISGMINTGKSTLLNRLIIHACEAYPPEQLQLTLLDFKDGVSFWEYEGLAHIQQLYAPVEDNIEQALYCIAQFEKTISQRNTLFRQQRVARLCDYNQKVSLPLPRHFLVIDELQSLFEGRNEQQQKAASQLLSNIAKKGASTGLHAILCTQSFQNVLLDEDIKEQFHLRIGFQHASAKGCQALMGSENLAMLDLSRFEVTYNNHQGDIKYNQRIALDNMPNFLERLDALKAHYA